MGLKFLSVCCVMEGLPSSFFASDLLKINFRCFSLRFSVFQILYFQQPHQLQSVTKWEKWQLNTMMGWQAALPDQTNGLLLHVGTYEHLIFVF